MELYRSLLENAIYYLFPLSLLESLLLFRRGRADLRETLTNLSSNALGRIVRITLTGGILISVLGFTRNFAFFSLPVNGWTFVLTLLVADFIYYWKHRFSHQIRILWSYHSVHHSSWQFNLSTALRLPWLGSFLDSFFYIPAVLLGFDPLLLAISKGTILLFQYPIHTEMIGKLGILDRIFNTPSNHRVHHGVNPLYLDKNHGGILIIWDRIFGTYQQELEKVRYGLTTPVNTNNPFRIQFFEPIALIRDLAGSRDIQSGFKYLFGRPGWKPASGKDEPGQQKSLAA